MSEALIGRVLESIARTKHDIKDNWAAGNYTEETVEGTAQQNAKAIGRYQALEDVEDLIEELKKEWEDDNE
jgi:hypothetical protein